MKYLSYLSIAAIGFLSACDKEAVINAEYNAAIPMNHAYVKFVHAYSAATPTYTAGSAPTIQIELNSQKITPTALALGSVFPANEYTAVNLNTTPSTSYAIKMSTGTPATTIRDSLLLTIAPILRAGNYTTYFFYDNNGVPAIQAVQDDIRDPAGANYFRIRFANFIPNPPAATPAIDVFSVNNNAVVLSNIPYRGVSSYIELPRTATSDIFRLRWAGTTTNISTVTANTQATVTTNNMNSFTIIARGQVGASGTRVPAISVTRDR